MTNHMRPRITTTTLLIFSLIFPSLLFARSNILTTGIGVSLDYNERQYADYVDDPATEADERLTPRDEDDYRSLVITPLVVLRSSTPRDNVEISFEPDLRYDLIDYDTDWDANATVAADRFINRNWQLGISNHFLRSDYYSTDTDVTEPEIEPGAPPALPTSPELSADVGRTKYWRNTVNLFSDYFYREDSLFRLGFNYAVLRYDEDFTLEEDNYDRYEVFTLVDHRFNAVWSTSLDLRLIRGDFEPTDPGADTPPLTYDDLSADLKEYRLLYQVDNESIPRNPLYAQFSYIGTKYDEALRDDSDIYELRFNWRRDFSSRMYTILGVGPSYEKTENRDGNWDGNGIAEINYLTARGAYNFAIEKRYDVVNFDGTREQGVVDYWDTRFTLSYDISRNLSLTGRLSYLYEDREDPVVGLAGILELDDPLAALEDLTLTEIEEYHNDRYLAGIGLAYTFWQYYTARLDYTFTKQESDRINEDYDDHRLLLTLSWEKDILNW